MLGRIRAIFAHSWIARISAAVLAVAFGAWGIQGALTGGGVGAQDVATVGAGGAVSVADFDGEFRRALEGEAQSLAQKGSGSADPSAVPPPLRREVGEAVLKRLVNEQVLVAHAHAIGLSVPDAIVRDSIFAIPAFKGPDGQFDRARFDQVLQANHMTEPQVLGLVRNEILTQAAIDPVRDPAAVPPVITRTLFDYAAETRALAIVDVPSASVPAPAAPDDATLRRFYTNHPGSFTVPAFRHIRVVVLSPDTVGRDIHVSEADIRSAYAAARFQLFKPARRTVEVATLPDEARAASVARFWQGGADWKQVEAMAQGDGGTATELTDAAEREFPSPSLGTAVFAAEIGKIAGPAKEELGGFATFRVVDIKPASGDYGSEHDTLRDALATQRAAALIPDRVDRLQDAIAGGGLDKIPADLGAVAAAGTLDEHGTTPEGEPAPLPATGALRNAIIARAFSQAAGAPAQLVQGPKNSGWYALAVDTVTPPRRRTFDEARADVLRDWTAAAQAHAANERATAIYTAAVASHSLDAAGLPVQHPPAFRRGGSTPAGVPSGLVPVAFTMKEGAVTMAASPDGYAVAVLTAINHPQPASEQAGFDRLGAEAREALGNDAALAYTAALTERARPQVNAAAVERVIGEEP